MQSAIYQKYTLNLTWYLSISIYFICIISKKYSLLTCKDPLDRIRELGDASVPFEFDVHALIYSDNAPGLERQLHRRFLKLQMNKLNPRKEFFNVGIIDIKDAVNDLGITAKWTLMAEAKHYRESLAITEAMKNNKNLERDWEHFQEEAEIQIQEKEMEAIE